MGNKFCTLVVSSLFLTSLAVLSEGSPVKALSYPVKFKTFATCVAPSDEFCIETFEFTPTNRDKQVIANPAPDIISDPTAIVGRTDPYINVFMSSDYSGPSSVSAMMPSGMAINFSDPVGSIPAYPPNGATTLDGLKDGQYRVVVRTGDYDPSIMLLTGKFDSYTITKGADGYFTIDLTLRPTPLASVAQFDGDTTMLDTCKANKWLTGCEANMAYRGWILASFGMLADSVIRDSVRGTWVSTNASVLQLAPGDFLSGDLNIDAQGPHYVPTDFGVPGLTKEGTREVNSAYFEMYVPYAMVAKVMSTKMNQTVTVDQVKTYLDNPTQVLEGKIEEAASPTAAVVEKVQTLTFTKGDLGVRINFNLTHFSAPNPTLTIKAPGVAGSSSPKKLPNGATVSPATSATKGKTLTAKSLLSPSSGASVTKVVSKSATVCKVTGTKVKMLKAGTCKLSVTVKYKSKSSTTAVSIKVS